jgi:hypothetical protein
MKLLGTAVLALLCACNPNYEGGGFRCSNGQCPSGYTCSNGICGKNGLPGFDAATDKPVVLVDGTGKPPDRNDQKLSDTCAKVVTCWPDPDGDGFAGKTATPSTACGTCPAKSTDKDPKLPANLDCHPDNPDVFPGQKQWFVKSYCLPCDNPGCPCVGSWDFDCSGTAEKQYQNLAGTCAKNGVVCTGGGWTGGNVPNCGAGATFQSCAILTCNPSTGPQTQGCH